MNTSDSATSPGRVVLLVEDNQQTSTAMKALLELEHYAVSVAGDGESALRLLRGGLRPNLILLDLRLPGKDAFAFRVEQLQEPSLCRIPIVVYSGATDVEERAKSLGAVAWFHKPVEVDTLLDLVARYCV